jgi:hypothetical protein
MEPMLSQGTLEKRRMVLGKVPVFDRLKSLQMPLAQTPSALPPVLPQFHFRGGRFGVIVVCITEGIPVRI